MFYSALAVFALAASGLALQPRCEKKTCSSSAPTPSTTTAATTSCAEYLTTTWVTYTITHTVDYRPETASSVVYGAHNYTATENKWTPSTTSTLPTWVFVPKNITSTLIPLTSGHKCLYPSCDKTSSASWTSTAKPTSAGTAPPKPSITQNFEGTANRCTAGGVAGAVLAAAFFAFC